MTVRYLGDGEWKCLDADTKPANAAVGDKLTVTDTKRVYIKTGPLSADWMDIEHNPMPDMPEILTNKSIGDFLDFYSISVPGNPAGNIGRLYIKQIDGQNEGLFVKLKKSGVIVEEQLL